MTRLIVLEGPNGGGKTTTAPLLQRALQTRLGLRAAHFKRPTPGGDAARRIAELYAAGERGSPEIESLMTRDAVETRALIAGSGVDVAVLDRDWMSQVVYGGADMEPLIKRFGVPDMVCFLAAKPATMKRRIAARAKKYNAGTKEPGNSIEESTLRYDQYWDLYKRLTASGELTHWIDTSISTPYHTVAQIVYSVRDHWVQR